MKPFIPSFTAAFLAISGAALAGIPTTTQLTCPIGGQVFNITETLSCTTYGDRTMSFGPTTSCDFVTKLPQCPDNFLPLYKEFSEPELLVLEDYITSESFNNSVDESRFYLAYMIGKQLGDDPAETFWTLLNGLWFDPENTFTSPLYMEAFFFESIGELKRIDERQLPFVQAIVAFAHVKSSQPEQAAELLEKVKSTAFPADILTDYILRIETCMLDSQSQYCQPNQSILAD